MAKLLGLAALLFGLWIAFSTFLEPLYLFLGALSVGLSLYLTQRLALLDDDGFPHSSAIKLPLYWIWLGVEVIKSNFRVTGLILAKDASLKQRFLHIPSTQKSELAKAIFANSITLTPGTVTVAAKDKMFLVHVLSATPDDQASLEEMGKRVSAIEGKS